MAELRLLKVEPGEIHALIGENGAGKSTLMKILSGAYQRDSGQIFIDGKEVKITNPKESKDLGVAIIYQEFMLAPDLTVAENIFIDKLSAGKATINWKKLRADAREQLEKLGFSDINPNAKCGSLSVAYQQVVEICKCLTRDAKILVFDEPTAVLTPDEVRELFGTLRNMAAMGCTIIFITHKMNEVMEFADRITVLRDGCLVKALKKEETTEQELAQLMVGREISMGRRNTENTTRNEAILRVKGLTVLNDKKLKAVNDLSFDLYAGEILGIAGVSGNGQKELMEALAGLRPTVSGHLEVRGEDISRSSPRERIGRGVAFIPEDRYGFALIKTMTVTENASLKCYRKPEFCRRGVLNYRKLEQQAG